MAAPAIMSRTTGMAHNLQKRNHARSKSAKVEMRRRVLAAIGADQARVFDAFAGTGEMYREVWRAASAYVGCDLEWFRDARPAYVADNLRVMRALDLAEFNVFDLDAFGSPWEQALILAARRTVAPGERIGVVLTEGSGMNLKFGGMPHALAQLAGIRVKTGGMVRWQEELIDRAIAGLASRLNTTVEARWQAERTGGTTMRYCALVLVGREGPREH